MQFDGNTVGLLQNIRMSDDYAPEPASGIGDIHAIEYVPTMARHTVTAETMILFNGALREMGIAPENGDAVLQGNVFDICVMSKDDGSILRKIMSCSFASGDTEISKHAILTSNCTFNALDVSGTSM
ncbi:hypothetical protein [Burkholderia sp. Ac-20349]|uniref:hypothetical protein n=1 Tax=Burkholderia sp. Ac-20349 TaxID=2703893 RepID=UPI00197BD270|nr:hypothetical protein [Burkholderia sp. Ac-20349]MBN3839279.1 hypothetical protein [Burkholderia sp. Ac-20349]